MGRSKRLNGPHKYFEFFVIFFLLISTGCATKEALKSVRDEEALRERVMSYWNLRVNGDHIKSYEYELPQGRLALESYIKRHSDPAIQYKSFELESIVKKDGDVADVQLAIVPVVKVPGARAFEHTTSITERWVRVDGIWYHASMGTSKNLIHKKEEGGDVQN